MKYSEVHFLRKRDLNSRDIQVHAKLKYDFEFLNYQILSWEKEQFCASPFYYWVQYEQHERAGERGGADRISLSNA